MTFSAATNNMITASPTAPNPKINIGRLAGSFQAAFNRALGLEDEEAGEGGVEPPALSASGGIDMQPILQLRG
jgi:hypothetical protein